MGGISESNVAKASQQTSDETKNSEPPFKQADKEEGGEYNKPKTSL